MMRTLVFAALPAALLLTACASAPCPVTSVSPPASAIDAAGARVGCPELAGAAAAADFVFVGESHDERSHHELQRELLEAMDQASGRPLALGMEMFQRPFQEPLDDYVEGRIDEREMLRRTEYFKRWNFDWTLYAPLWRFCRENGHRVVALNAEAGVIRRVGREGLAALSPDERAELAREIDLAVPSHRERILRAFTGGAHTLPEDRLARMYEAQTAWDETMAETAARAVPPDGRMLVVAGSYHLERRDGVPDRVARRRPGARQVVVVCRSIGEERPDDPQEPGVLGDFVVRLPESSAPTAKLGVMLGETHYAGLEVTGVVPGGAAAQAGVEAGDVIVGLGPRGAPELVTDMTDLRYMLDPAPIGSPLTLVVLRGDRRLALDATAAVPAPHAAP